MWKFFVDIFFSSLSSDRIGAVHPSNDYYHIIIAVLFAPFIETAFFQFIPIELVERFTLKYIKKKLSFCAVIVSALLFGFSHSYNWLSIIATCFSGLALSSTYVIFKYRKQSIGYAFVMTMLLHFIVNLIINLGRLFFLN
ncbi:MAG: CPBP family intramembrane metalloprotease [Bacteroidales bacterium]|nr:CPBP family intramembrane metalloprotease [Bacteroidales bacterium]